MAIGAIFSTACAIINFMALGMNGPEVIGRQYVILLLLNVVVAFVGEVANISLIKKVRPELYADPTGFGFKKEYFEQMDEWEKIKVGRASVKTMNSMGMVYVIGFLIALVCTALFGVSPMICLPIGILWLVQTILLVYHSCRQK